MNYFKTWCKANVKMDAQKKGFRVLYVRILKLKLGDNPL